MSKIIILFCLLFFTLGSVEVLAKTNILKHRIKNGDTFYNLAKRYHSTVQKIRRINNFRKNTILYVGKIIKIPTKVRKYKSKRKYTYKTKKKKKYKKSKYKYKKYSSYKKRQNRITYIAKTKLGRRYVWGASGRRNTYDCSGFSTYLYKKIGITLPRTARKQSRYGKYVRRSQLRKGDLLFFDTGKPRRGYVNHVAIYIGNNRFIHASSIHRKVIYGHFNAFYTKRYKGARRPNS
ncbi:Invasion associated protein p60 [hydrothermal vent metagenome]|uniref:Invasion associated protein p60 n=1 Tax=hydrothermal vent metagenome TaxID=652676 RepID=A0A1W1CLG6_9ZZZZ